MIISKYRQYSQPLCLRVDRRSLSFSAKGKALTDHRQARSRVLPHLTQSKVQFVPHPTHPSSTLDSGSMPVLVSSADRHFVNRSRKLSTDAPFRVN